MFKRLVRKLVPILVTVCMVFGLFPGGGISLNLHALIAAGTMTNPTPITESPATIQNPRDGTTEYSYFTFTAGIGGDYDFKIETTCTDSMVCLYSVDNSYNYVDTLIDEYVSDTTFSQTVTFVAGTKYVLQFFNPYGDTQATLTCAAIGTPLPAIEFSSAAVDADEAAGTVSLAVTRSGNLTGASSVTYQVIGGTATSGSDYTGGSGTLSFAANEALKTIPLPIVNDTISEAPETVAIQLSNPNNAKLGTIIVATVTVHDYVSAITVSGADSATTVPNGQTLQMSANVQPAEAYNKSVTWNVANGTGSATINTSGLLKGTAPGTVTVKATANDGSNVYDEQVITVTSPGTLQFSANAVDVDEAAGSVTVTIARTGGSDGAIQVGVGTPGTGTATKDVDYTNTSDTLTFEDGETSKTFSVPIIDDTISEDNETFLITMLPPTGGAVLGENTAVTVTIHDYVSSITVSGAGGAATVPIGQTLQMSENVQPTEAYNKSVTWSVANGTGTATINTSGVLTGTARGTVTVRATAKDGSNVYDDQIITVTSPGTLQFSTSTVDVDEAAGSVTVTVTRTGGSDGEVQLVVGTPGAGTATKDVDYTSDTKTLTFADGETSKTFTVPIIDDALADDGETFTITMLPPTGGAAVGAIDTVTVTIHDYVNSVVISSAGNTTTMLNGATLQMSAVVSPSDADQQVDWSVINGTGEATINASGLLTATQAGTVTVKATSKSIPSKNDTFTITINPNYGTLQFSSATYTVNENAGSVTLTVTRTGGSDGTVTLDYATANGTAIAGSDYTATSGTLTFTAGQTSKAIIVLITDDAIYESDATFTVTLSNLSNGTLGTSAATITIKDNDFVAVTAIDVSATGGVSTVEAGKTLTMVADVKPENASIKTVTWSIVPGTGTATINAATGLLTATTAGSVTVRAASNDGSAVTGEKTITITVPPVTVSGVTVSPSSVSMLKGADKTFTALVSGTGNPSQTVTWTVSGNKKIQTTISNTGRLSIASDETATTLTVRATSAVDSTKSGTAVVTVTTPATTGGNSDTTSTVIVNSTSIASCDLSRLTLPSGVTSVSLVSRLVNSNGTNTTVKNLAQRIGTVGSGGMKLYYLALLNQYNEEISGYNGSFRVRLLIPQGMSGDIRVYRFSEISGSLMDMQAVRNVDGMEFETSRLGYFAVVQHTGKTRPAIPETGAPRQSALPLAVCGGVVLAACGSILIQRKRNCQ